ncbi:peptide ABC transporter substrate-binding protein [Kiritimatiellaeota bacterium B1221]|nr:peptide ABC transporter substrate-binding protein [Kiritimatiellaeota bacterium B1221]
MKSLLIMVVCMLSALGLADTRVEEGNREGYLHLGNGAEPESLDPHLTTGVPEHQIISALMEGLIREDGKTLKPKPGVAKSWEQSEDGTVFTFALREDAKWSNGDPVTAKDFVFSYRRMLSPQLGAEYAYMLYVIKNGRGFNQGLLEDPESLGVKALDDHTLEITLEQPSPYFLNMLNHYAFYPVHEPTLRKYGAVNERGNPWAREGRYVGNGPFRLEEWSLKEQIFVSKSPTYWNREAMKLKGIFFYPVEDQQTEERMFRSGLLHKTGSVPLPRLPYYQKNKPGLLYSHPYLTTYYYLINTRKAPFDDVRVRQALSLSLQRELLTEKILKGGQKPAKWFTPPGTGGFQASHLLEEDLVKAKKLLADAGYPEGKGFPKFELMYNTSESHRTIAQVVQQMWKRNLGVECELVNKEWQVYMVTRRELDFDVARAGWAGDYADPHNFLDLHLSGGGNNHTGWGSEKYDRLIDKAAGTTDSEARFKLYDKAEEILLEEMPVIPIYWYTQNYLIDPSVKGWSPNILDRHDYTEVYLESAK